MLINIVDTAFMIFKLLVFARIILSWVRLDPSNPIVRFIYEMTEPVMGPLRRIIPSIGMIDISPIVLFLALDWVQRIVRNILLGL